jgi:gamma-glutamylcyclotransferase
MEKTEYPIFLENYVIVRKNVGNSVGEIRNYTLDETGVRKIKIIKDDKYLKETNMRFILSTWNEYGPTIIVNADFLNLDENFQDVGLFHEIGHIHNEDHINFADETNEEKSKRRINHILQNKLMSEEEKADYFALENVEKEDFIKFIKFLLNSRPNCSEFSKNNLGKRELEIRINRAKKYKPKKNIYYFAYGSNLWFEQMKKRCPNSEYIKQGSLKNYCWVISSRGYANIKKLEDSSVIGTIFKITRPDEYRLDEYEGVNKKKYYKKYLNVRSNGILRRCLTYIDYDETEGIPKTEYIERINKGIIDANLPKNYIKSVIRKYIPQSANNLDLN